MNGLRQVFLSTDEAASASPSMMAGMNPRYRLVSPNRKTWFSGQYACPLIVHNGSFVGAFRHHETLVSAHVQGRSAHTLLNC